MSKLNETVKVLVNVHNDKMREISNLKRAADKAGLYEGLSESDTSSFLGTIHMTVILRLGLRPTSPTRSPSVITTRLRASLAVRVVMIECSASVPGSVKCQLYVPCF